MQSVLIAGSVVSIQNLQCNSNRCPPVGFATDRTVFSQNPTERYLIDAFQKMNKKTKVIDRLYHSLIYHMPFL